MKETIKEIQRAQNKSIPEENKAAAPKIMTEIPCSALSHA